MDGQDFCLVFPRMTPDFDAYAVGGTLFVFHFPAPLTSFQCLDHNACTVSTSSEVVFVLFRWN